MNKGAMVIVGLVLVIVLGVLILLYQEFPLFGPVSEEIPFGSGGEKLGEPGGGDSPGQGATIGVNYPVSYLVVQRDSSGQGTIEVSGSYSGNAVSVEARRTGWSGESQASSWEIIDGSPHGGVFSGNLEGIPTGYGTIQVRVNGLDSTIISIGNVGVGDVYVVAGGPNAEGRGIESANANHAGTLASVYDETDNWKIADDPVDSDVSLSSWVPYLASRIVTNVSIPVAFITAAEGNSGILEWHDRGSSAYNNMISQVVGATRGTMKIKSMIFYSGEVESNLSNSVSYLDYKNGLSQLAGDFFADTGRGVFVVQMGAAFQGDVNANRESVDNIRKAQQDSWDESNIFPGGNLYDIPTGSGSYFLNQAQLSVVADRIWAAVCREFYGCSDGLGPVIADIRFSSTQSNDRVNLTFVENSLPLIASTNGFYIFDPVNGILTQSNISQVNVSGATVTLFLDSNLSSNSQVYYASYNDANNLGALRDSSSFSLPAVPIYSHSILPADYAVPQPSGGNGGSGGGGGGGGGGGAPPAWISTVNASESEVDSGYSTNLGARYRIQFTLGSEVHHVGVRSISGNAVSLEIASTPQVVSMTEGETKLFDVTGDNVNDVSVSLVSVSPSVVRISIKRLEQPSSSIPVQQSENGGQTVSPGNAANSGSNLILVLVIGIVLVVTAIVLVFLLRRKRNQGMNAPKEIDGVDRGEEFLRWVKAQGPKGYDFEHLCSISRAYGFKDRDFAYARRKLGI